MRAPTPAAAARGLEEALTNNELIMARRNASELIMDITAMNNELIMARRNASQFIMAISAMNNIFITSFCFLYYFIYMYIILY